MEAFDPEGLIGLGGVLFIQGLVAAFKTTFPNFPPQYLVSIAMAFGLIINVALAYFIGFPYWQAVLQGLAAGMAASGVYTAGKRASGLQ